MFSPKVYKSFLFLIPSQNLVFIVPFCVILAMLAQEEDSEEWSEPVTISNRDDNKWVNHIRC